MKPNKKRTSALVSLSLVCLWKERDTFAILLFESELVIGKGILLCKFNPHRNSGSPTCWSIRVRMHQDLITQTWMCQKMAKFSQEKTNCISFVLTRYKHVYIYISVWEEANTS